MRSMPGCPETSSSRETACRPDKPSHAYSKERNKPLKTAVGNYLSWPAASRFTSVCAARIQNLSCSRLKVCTPVRLDMSQTLMLLSSELDTIMSCMQCKGVWFWAPGSARGPGQVFKTAFAVDALAATGSLESVPDALTCRAWNMTQDTLLTCPLSVSTSHAFVSAAS